MPTAKRLLFVINSPQQQVNALIFSSEACTSRVSTGLSKQHYFA